MKNNEIKSKTKSARKSAAADIESTVLTALKNIAAKFGQDAKHLQKQIEKGAAKLGKKLSKEMKFNKPSNPAPVKTDKATTEAGKSVKAVNGVGKPQAAAKPAAPASKAAPAKKPEPTASNSKTEAKQPQTATAPKPAAKQPPVASAFAPKAAKKTK